MFNRHQCTWVDQGDYEYHPAFSYEHHGWLAAVDQDRNTQRALNGWTTWHQRCSACGDVRTQDVLGRFTGQLTYQPQNVAATVDVY